MGYRKAVVVRRRWHGRPCERRSRQPPGEGDAAGAGAAGRVPAAVLMAHQAVCRESKQVDPERGMGSTVVTAQIGRRAAQIVWVATAAPTCGGKANCSA